MSSMSCLQGLSKRTQALLDQLDVMQEHDRRKRRREKLRKILSPVDYRAELQAQVVTSPKKGASLRKDQREVSRLSAGTPTTAPGTTSIAVSSPSTPTPTLTFHQRHNATRMQQKIQEIRNERKQNDSKLKSAASANATQQEVRQFRHHLNRVAAFRQAEQRLRAEEDALQEQMQYVQASLAPRGLASMHLTDDSQLRPFLVGDRVTLKPQFVLQDIWEAASHQQQASPDADHHSPNNNMSSIGHHDATIEELADYHGKIGTVSHAVNGKVSFVLFGNHERRTFTVPSTALHLVSDPSMCGAPFVTTPSGDAFELLSVDVTLEIVGDTAVLTHRTSWVPPRRLQLLTDTVETAVVAPLLDGASLTAFQADVGESRLRSAALLDEDGIDIIRRTCRARQLRLQKGQAALQQQLQQQQQGVDLESTRGSDVSTGAILKQATPCLSQQYALPPSLATGKISGKDDTPNDEHDDPLHFIHKEGANPVMFRNPFGVWNDAFDSLEALYGHGQRSTVIPLKEHRCNELIHVTLQYSLTGTVCVRSLPQTTSGGHSQDPESTGHNSRSHGQHTAPAAHNRSAATDHWALHFTFPSKFPVQCLPSGRRNFDEISSLNVVVCGLSSRMFKLETYPQTSIDPHPQAKYSHHILAQKSGPWQNTDIDVFLTACRSSLEVEFAGVVDSGSSVPGVDSFLLAAVIPTTHSSCEVLMRRCVAIILDLDHDGITSFCSSEGTLEAELDIRTDVMDAVASLLGSLSPVDQVNLCVFDGGSLWAMSSVSHEQQLQQSKVQSEGSLSREFSFAKASSFKGRGQANGQFLEVGHDVGGFCHRAMTFITNCRSAGAKPTNSQTDVGAWLRSQVQPLVKLGEHDHRVQKQQEDIREIFVFTAAALREESRVKISGALPALLGASVHVHTALVQPFFSGYKYHSASKDGDDSADAEGEGSSRALSERLLLGSHFWRAVANHTHAHHAHVTNLHAAAAALQSFVALTAHPISGDVALTLPGVDDIMVHGGTRPFTRLGVCVITGSYGLPGTQKFSTVESATFTCQTSRAKKLMKRASLPRISAGLSQSLVYKNIRAEVDRAWLPYHLSAAGAGNPSDEYFSDPLLVETRVNVACKFNNPLPQTAVLPLVYLDRDESGGYCAAAEEVDEESSSQNSTSKPESPTVDAIPTLPTDTETTARQISSFCQATVGLYVYFLFGAKNDTEPPIFSVADSVQATDSANMITGAAALTQSTSFTASRDANRKKVLSQMLENGVFTRIRASLNDKMLDDPAHVTVTGKPPSRLCSKLTHWFGSAAAAFEQQTIELRASEHDHMRSIEKAEFCDDVQLQYDFHWLRIQLQLLEVRMKRSLCELEEEERLLRADLETVQLKFWEKLESETSGERIDIRRLANVLRDHRLRLSYQEEEERHLIASDQGLMWSVAHFAVHASVAPADIQYSLVILEHFFSVSAECVAFVAKAIALWVMNPSSAAAFGTESGAISQIKEALEKNSEPESVIPILRVVHSLTCVRANHGKIEASNVVRDVINSCTIKNPNSVATQIEAVRTLAALASVSQSMRITITNNMYGLRTLLANLHLFMAHRAYVCHVLTLLLELAPEQSSHSLIGDAGAQVLSTCTGLVHPADMRIRTLYFKVIGAVASSRATRMTLACNSQPTRLILQTLRSCLGASSAATLSEREALLKAGTEALKCLRQMIGNVAEFPASQLAMTLSSTLRELVAADSDLVVKEAELVRLILSRFSMVPSTEQERPYCDASLMPMFRPWSSLTVVNDDSGSGSSAFTMLGCCYGLVKRARLVVGGVETACIVRMFSRDTLVQHINPYDAHTGETISVEVAEGRLNALYFCLLSLQLEDALENSVVCPANQLQCLGFSCTPNGTHATIFAIPPRYSLRHQLALLRSRGQVMMLSALLQLIVVLMEQLVYLDACGGRVHGALDLDNIFSNDDFSQQTRPKIVVGPCAAISADISGLVPDLSQQTLLDPEEFAEAGAQAALDDERDVHRTILEALNYGAEIDEGNDVDYLLNKIPSYIANLVFGLARLPPPPPEGAAGPSNLNDSTVSSVHHLETTMEPSPNTPHQQRFSNTPRQVRDALCEPNLQAWAATTGVPF